MADEIITLTIDNAEYLLFQSCRDENLIEKLMDKKIIDPNLRTENYFLDCVSNINQYKTRGSHLGEGGYNLTYHLENSDDLILRITKRGEKKDTVDDEISGYFVQSYLSKPRNKNGIGCKYICKVYEFGHAILKSDFERYIENNKSLKALYDTEKTNYETEKTNYEKLKTQNEENIEKNKKIWFFGNLFNFYRNRLQSGYQRKLDEVELKIPKILNKDLFESVDSRAYGIIEKVDSDFFRNVKRGYRESHGINLKKYFKNVLEGLTCMNNSNFVHLDIKLENIGINTQDREARIFDFGFARYLPNDNYKINVRVGTIFNIDPAIIDEKAVHFNSDVYSIGVDMLDTYFGTKLKKGTKAVDIPTDKYWESYEMKRFECSQQSEIDIDLLADLVRQMININPDERCSASTAASHAWFTNPCSEQSGGTTKKKRVRTLKRNRRKQNTRRMKKKLYSIRRYI